MEKNIKISEEEYYRRLLEWVDGKRQTNALIRYYFHIEPYDLELETWARRVIELHWVRTEEAKNNQA